MSYSMTVEVKQLPPVEAVLAALGPRAIQCAEAPDGLSRWPRGIIHLHELGESTRGVELIIEDSEVRARMVSLANPADWQLAFDLLAAFAPRRDARILGEDGTAATVDALRSEFVEVIERELGVGLITVLDMTARDDIEEMTFNGAVRTVYIGSRIANELGGTAPDEALRRLLDLIRRIQYIEREGFELVESSDLGSLLGIPVEMRLSIWNPTAAQAFAPTRLLGLRTPAGNLYVPVEALPELLGPRFAWLDEQQFTIAPTPEAELPALHARARKVAVELTGGTGGKRKWWQVWKR
jgi:hypothetical protein